jgi:hypothetical protein
VGRGRPSLRDTGFVAASQRSRSLGALEVPDLAEVVVTRELVADLYDPHLVITAHYVGTDPRYRERHLLSFVRGTLVALVSAALAVALTLALTHRTVGSADVTGSPSPPSPPAAGSPLPSPEVARVGDRPARGPAGSEAKPSSPAAERTGSGTCHALAGVAPSSACTRPSAALRRTARAARAAARAARRSVGQRGWARM